MGANEVKLTKDMIEQQIRRSSNVFLIGHNSPDFDSIGACLGLYEMATSFGKKAYIIVDDDPAKIESGVKRIIDENKENYRFIKKSDVPELKKDRSLLILCDTNKRDLISVGENLNWFDRVVILDHHEETEMTVDTPYKIISTDISSASEMVARLLMASKTKYSKVVANALLAGISLDTKRFRQNTTSKTHDVAEKLIDNGADVDFVNNLFLQEFESFCRIGDLIINGTLIRQYSDISYSPLQVSFTLNRNEPKKIYLKEDFAKAADRMMKFEGIDAAFALGYVDDEYVHISARSGKRLNVGAIMKEMCGGGNPQNAGTRIKRENLLEVEEELMKKIPLGLSQDTSIQNPPQFVKLKK